MGCKKRVSFGYERSLDVFEGEENCKEGSEEKEEEEGGRAHQRLLRCFLPASERKLVDMDSTGGSKSYEVVGWRGRNG